MSIFKNLSISFFLFATLFINFAHAARFNIKSNCPYVVWAAAVPGGDRQLNSKESWPLDVNASTTGAAFGLELGAFFMDPGVAVVKLVIVVGLFNAKPMVHPKTPLPNSL